jgi:hypothetical protein
MIQEFSDETIRRFLLGELNAIEQSKFEEQFLVSDELEARVQLAELDLADDFAYARISGADRSLFEQSFLLTGERKRKLIVSTALRDRFAASPALETKASTFQRLRNVFDFQKPVWRYAFAALVLAILVATAWLVIKDPKLVARLLPKRVIRKPVATSSTQEAAHPKDSSTPNHTEQSPQMPVHESPVTIRLDPKVPIDQAPAVKLPSDGNEVVRLQLTIENQSGTFRAEVLTISGESIYGLDSLTSYDGHVVNIDVPARVLKNGSYQVRLSGSQNGSPASWSYYFRVQ